MEIERGDIIMVDCNGNGNVQRGIRPCLIIQNNIGNKYSPTTIVVPLTSEIKKQKQPTHEIITRMDAFGLKCDSMALCEQILTIDKRKITEKIGKVINNITMESVSKACSISLGL